MLLLLFDVAADRYALDCRHVVEVLPLVQLKRIPMAPAGVAGVLNYRGAAVPVIDVTALLLGRPSRESMSTRLIVVRHLDERGDERLLGLIAEHATETTRRTEADFVASGIHMDHARYLGPVATDARGVVQLIDVSGLLPPDVRDVLFTQPVER